MLIYLIGAAITSGILLNAFLKDDSTPMTDIRSWMVLLISTLLWFAILPSMIYKQVTKTEPTALSVVAR